MLAFRRFDFLSFRGFMTRFATLLRLRGGDLPFGEEEQPEEEAEPSFETERERQIFELKKMSAKKSGFAGIAGIAGIAGMTGGRRVDRAKEEMTEAEARALVLEGCDDDATLATLVWELDDCCTVQTSMFSKEARREARAACCSSLTLLSLQSYYFYWCLFFVLAGDYSRSVWPLPLRRSAARFARYSDRVFTYLVGSSASHTFPSFLPFTLHGALRPFVESVSKTLLLVDVLKAKGQHELVEKVFLDLFSSTRLGIVFNTKTAGSSGWEGERAGTSPFIRAPVTILLESESHQQYTYPQLPVRTVASHLLSRPVLLELCAHYLEEGQWDEGLQLLQGLFPNIAKEECPGRGRVISRRQRSGPLPHGRAAPRRWRSHGLLQRPARPRAGGFCGKR